MARTTIVKAARKKQPNCESCGREINIGDSYKWVKPRAFRGAAGWKRVRCMECPGWRPSELSSSKMASVMAAQEDFGASNFDNVEDLAQGMRDVAEAARGVAEEYTESADNQEEYFPGSPTAEESREKAEQLEGWADEIDSAADEVESATGEDDDVDCVECSETFSSGPHHEFEEPEREEGEPEPTADDTVLCAKDDCDAEEEDHHDFQMDISALQDDKASIVDESPV